MDRASIHRYIYGRTGDDTANFIVGPEQYVSKNTHYEFNIAKAIRLLDDAGWKLGDDGVRKKNGVRLHAGFQTSNNEPRLRLRRSCNMPCRKAGITIELKVVTASVFFSSDEANPNTFAHFVADLQMYSISSGPAPRWFMRQFLSSELTSKANRFQGRPLAKPGLRLAVRADETALNPVRRAAMFIAPNDMGVDDWWLSRW